MTDQVLQEYVSCSGLQLILMLHHAAVLTKSLHTSEGQ